MTHSSADPVRSFEISIIIVTYFSRTVITQCLQSLGADHLTPGWEIILVDNSIADGTSTVVRQNFSHVQVITNATNAGFPAAVNQGAQRARGRYILLLNPDAAITVAAIQAMISWMDCHDLVAACGPRINYSADQQQPSILPIPTLTSIVRSLYKDQPTMVIDQDQPTICPPDTYLLGACFLIRRTAWETIGPLDEDLFWVEDADWSFRARKAGWQLAYLPQIPVMHIGQASADKNIYIKLTRQHLNKLDFFKKHYSWIQQWVLRFILLLIVGTKTVIRLIQYLLGISSDAGLRLKAYYHVIGVLLGLKTDDHYKVQ